MPHDEAYYQAEKKIKKARHSGVTKRNLSRMKLTELPESLGELTHLISLDLSSNFLTELPEWLGQLSHLQSLNLSNNQLKELPKSICKLTELQSLNLDSNRLTSIRDLLDQLTPLTKLRSLNISNNHITTLPASLGNLSHLHSLNLSNNQLKVMPDTLRNLIYLASLNFSNNRLVTLPEWLGEFTQLRYLRIWSNKLTDIPSSVIPLLEHLERLDLSGNPLNPELAAANEQGFSAVKSYLAAKATAQITLNEAKLILIGEGEVGKTCLMDALLGNPWQEHDTTHGIEIQSFNVTTDTQTEITLNAWDFGGQRVYRPTHQLFFSAPTTWMMKSRGSSSPSRTASGTLRITKTTRPCATSSSSVPTGSPPP